MTTWQLWRNIKLPVDLHPVFWHIKMSRHKTDSRLIWGTAAVLAIITFFVFPDAIIILLVMAPLFYALMNVSINGVVWTVNTAETLTRERERGTYDILCVIPDGALQVNWIVFVERLHYKQSLNNSLGEMRSMLMVMGMISAFIFFGGVVDANASTTYQVTIMLAMIFAVGLAMYIDYIQSVITSGLVAIITANLTVNPSDARLWSITSFITIQVVMYTILIAFIWIVSNVYAGFDRIPLLIGIITPSLVVLLFVAIRELLIWTLWRWLTDRLNAASRNPSHMRVTLKGMLKG